jgi:hypothetical protein
MSNGAIEKKIVEDSSSLHGFSECGPTFSKFILIDPSVEVAKSLLVKKFELRAYAAPKRRRIVLATKITNNFFEVFADFRVHPTP